MTPRPVPFATFSILTLRTLRERARTLGDLRAAEICTRAIACKERAARHRDHHRHSRAHHIPGHRGRIERHPQCC